MKIYLAGPLFSEAEQNWLRHTKERIAELAEQLDKEVAVIWPYELISDEEISALGREAKTEIFVRCKAQLDTSDIVVALLDGSQVDDGTAWEIGYFYAKKPVSSYIIGIRTDFRNAGDTQYSKVNAMIEASCDTVVESSDALLKTLSALFKTRKKDRKAKEELLRSEETNEPA